MGSRRGRTKQIAVCAVLSALSLVLLYLASLLPTSRLALVAVAGLLPALAVMAYGVGWGFSTFLVTAALALLILPTKDAAVVYCLFFGHYPVVKSLIERLNRFWLEWVLKLLWANLLILVCWLLFRAILFHMISMQSVATLVLFLAGNVAFIVYDICFSGLIKGAEKIVRRIR